MRLRNFFKRAKPEKSKWIPILFEDCSGIENIFETDEYLLALDAAEKFVRSMCDPKDWVCIRAQQGYIMVTVGYEFRYEEDAAAFKLRWG